MRALKAILGLAAVIGVLVNGVMLGGCPPDAHCLVSLRFYSMRLDLWSISAALFGLGLLLSVLKDVLSNLRRIEVLERSAESIADIE